MNTIEHGVVDLHSRPRLKVCVLSPIRSVMDKYSVPICSIRFRKACEGTGKQGYLLHLSQNSFEGCVQKAIYLHKGTS